MTQTQTEDHVEYKLGNLKEFLNDNDEEKMKEIDLGGEIKCLLIKNKSGELSALSHKCTHYGAPLVKGILENGRVRCPWHGACFNAKTGDIEDFPGVDSLQQFKVSRNGNDVTVKMKKTQLQQTKRNTLLETCHESVKNGNDASDNRVRVVIVGGGPATLTCAETLRKDGFKGQIVVLCKDKHPTFDRPKLSKALDVAPEAVYLRSLDYYEKIDVEFCLNTEVVSVDVLTKSVHLSSNLTLKSGETSKKITYDNLVLATGGQPRTLAPLSGWNLRNVFVLRTISDANAIKKVAKDKNVLVVGSSFIGMEVASYLASENVSSSLGVVCGTRSSVPFQNSFGKEIGSVIKKMHEEKGVKFYPQVGVSSLLSKHEANVVSHVTLTDGQTIKADVVVVGTGVSPATSFLKDSEIPLAKNGYIPVDGRMQTKVPHVYAIGDICLFPLKIRDGTQTNIQHWQMAHQHGVLAARDIVRSLNAANGGRNLANSSSSLPVNSVPFFWTVQFGVSIRYSGYGAGYDDIVIRGDLHEQKFVAYYVANDIVVAVATMKMDPVAAKFAEDLYNGRVVRRKDIPNN